MKFFFTPAINAGDKLIIEHHSYCFFNPAGWFPTKNHLLKKIPMTLSDSGGYQIYRRNEDYRNGIGPKKCIVIPFVGIKKTKGVLILDPIDLCQKYGELGIDYGFTLDYPLSDNFSNREYRINLEKSYKWAELMFSKQPTMCPTTKLLIPLHYYTENQLRHYYRTMSKLDPTGYAIPVRHTGTWEYMLRNAYALAYLHHKRVNIVHLFGSSRTEIIILGAVAIRLKMFQQLTFDSTSWNTARYKSEYMNPRTLKRYSIENNPKIKLELPKALVREIQSSYINLAQLRKIIVLHNVFATRHYANDMRKRSKDIEALKMFIKRQPHLKIQRKRLLSSIELLQDSVVHGFSYVENWYESIWY